VLGSALLVTALACYGFSRATGLVGQVVDAPVGAFAATTGVLLTAGAPARFGWGWQGTGRHWRAVLAALAGAVAVVATYRLLGQTAPYQSSAAEFVLVPLGEEVLFRGFVLTVLLIALRRCLPARAAARWAVVIGAVGFGVGHLGNFGYVPVAFLLIQVAVAVAIALVAGWLRMLTGSLVGAILVHAAINVVAVA